ncbi:MAG: transcription antitermination factor NusB [Culicoidibacterales bacterium]
MRKITREKVMKLLYTMDVYRQIAKEERLEDFLTTDIANELLVQQKSFLLNSKDDAVYFDATFFGIVEHLPAIDDKINQYTKKTWSIEQFGYVERSLIRIAMYELYWSDQEGLHPKVIVSSILSLAEIFVDEKSIKFIHGILGATIQQIPTGEIKPKKVFNQYIPVDKSKAENNKARLKEFKAQKKRNEQEKLAQTSEINSEE